MSKAKYIIEKTDGVYEMYLNDREYVHRIAVTESEVLGKFVSLLSATLRYMKDGQTVILDCSKEG